MNGINWGGNSGNIPEQSITVQVEFDPKYSPVPQLVASFEIGAFEDGPIVAQACAAAFDEFATADGSHVHFQGLVRGVTITVHRAKQEIELPPNGGAKPIVGELFAFRD